MKLSLSLVAVKKITSSKPRSDFAANDLETAAQLILESEGVISPIVVRRTSLQSYEVVDGDFEYYAAARAREIDIRKGEMIGVFIIEPENEAALKRQVELFRNSKRLGKNEISVSDCKESTSTNIDLRLTNTESRMFNIESRFENRTNDLQAEFRYEIQSINEKLKEIENRIPKPIEPLEALNKLSLPVLKKKLKHINVNDKIIEKIFNERETNGQFTSFSNVVARINGLGDKTMLRIVDSFIEVNT